MKSFKYWGVTVALALLIGVGISWTITKIKERNDPLNKSDAFVYSNNGTLYWFELASRKGKLEGYLHRQKLVNKIEEPVNIEEKKYLLDGEKTEKGYEFKVKVDGEIITYDAWVSGPHLSVQKHGEKDIRLYNPVNKEELGEYIDALKNYHAEEKENNRLRKFFTDLRQVYGYLYTSGNSSYQLFIKIDEALQEGELRGSLLMMNDTGDKIQPYQETRYDLNGITDGLMVEFYTTVDEKKVKMTGNFHEGAVSFDLSFWKSDEKLRFKAVTEEEFKQRYEDFTKKVGEHR